MVFAALKPSEVSLQSDTVAANIPVLLIEALLHRAVIITCIDYFLHFHLLVFGAGIRHSYSNQTGAKYEFQSARRRADQS